MFGEKIYRDWNIIYKYLFPIAYLRYLGIVLSEQQEEPFSKNNK